MQIRPLWHSWTHSCPSTFIIHNFFPNGRVGPTSSLFLKYWYSETCLLSSSSLVVMWDPPLPNVFPTCKFIPCGTVMSIPAQLLPYFTISSLVAQWDLHLCSSSLVVYCYRQDKQSLSELFPKPSWLVHYMFQIGGLVHTLQNLFSHDCQQ